MPGRTAPIPAGYHSVTPYLSIHGAAEALDFHKRAFDAEEIYRLDMPDGKIGHAEIQIGSSRIVLADEFPDMPDSIANSPTALGGIARPSWKTLSGISGPWPRISRTCRWQR